ncbi:hypothetical protein [Rhizosphaericola mali]|uniref:Uncharacterized protein n=1 Tax=Rhizosphaericola mali TaxID=2545455 RepID=A0A5P2G0J1_9BACT|nr:hypothetical protein [Rhizosphaericola mali]QES88697.1 hypothetical protein E0W69_008545 [Rhizosphaericola mali]
MNFDDLYWNDSVIRKIVIDRSTAGKKDSVVVEVDWYDVGLGIIIFEDVYCLKLSMNFDVVAHESISDAYILSADQLKELNFNFQILNLIIDQALTCYVIKTASTGSEIFIISKTWKLKSI